MRSSFGCNIAFCLHETFYFRKITKLFNTVKNVSVRGLLAIEIEKLFYHWIKSGVNMMIAHEIVPTEK